MTGPDGQTNTAVKTACCCCTCCLTCIRDLMQMTNEMAYCDVVIQGSGYVTATKNVFKMMARYPADVALVQAMTKAVRILGTISIGGLGTYISHWVLTSETVASTFDNA